MKRSTTVPEAAGTLRRWPPGDVRTLIGLDLLFVILMIWSALYMLDRVAYFRAEAEQRPETFIKWDGQRMVSWSADEFAMQERNYQELTLISWGAIIVGLVGLALAIGMIWPSRSRWGIHLGWSLLCALLLAFLALTGMIDIFTIGGLLLQVTIIWVTCRREVRTHHGMILDAT